MLKIYVTNLKEYNNGKIIGEWVSLPCEGLEEVLNKISNNGNDELFISDYETDISNLKISEYDDILQLNEIAEEIDNLSAIIQFIMIVMICQMSHIKLLMRADYLTECRKQ